MHGGGASSSSTHCLARYVFSTSQEQGYKLQCESIDKFAQTEVEHKIGAGERKLAGSSVMT